VDESIYPLLAANAGGVMVYPASQNPDFARPRFKPDAILLGPGWGREAARRPVLEKALEAEASGVPLVLDADAIALAADCVFSGSTILTPHAGELAAFAGVPRDRLACESEILNEIAREKNAVILFKSHVMIVADGRRLVFIDGMNAALGAGGSGDLLAGLCAAIAARLHASREAAEDADARLHAPRENAAALLGDCAAAAAALLVEAARRHGRRFFDPLDLAESAARAAGEAWLRRGGL
jgi:NAD(P)H-hydrate epimerase